MISSIYVWESQLDHQKYESKYVCIMHGNASVKG